MRLISKGQQHQLSISELVVLVATAQLLLFGRGGMLAVFGDYTLLDRIINIFILGIAPIFVWTELLKRSPFLYLRAMWPMLLLMSWVILTLIFNPGTSYFPDQTGLITVTLSIFVASQVNRASLQVLRYMILFITAVFGFIVLFNYTAFVQSILLSSLQTRLGIDISPGNVIAYPRIMYTMVYTCLATFMIEERRWVRFAALAFSIIPGFVALATANRGTLVAFLIAVFAFSIPQLRPWKPSRLLMTGAILLLGLVGFLILLDSFPILQMRFLESGDSGRFEIWTSALEETSVIGIGVQSEYAHNIFLEFLQDYGIIGLVLFLVVLIGTLRRAGKLFLGTGDLGVLWVIGLFALQMSAQQFSLSIYTGTLWATFGLAIGICICDDTNSVGVNSVKLATSEFAPRNRL